MRPLVLATAGIGITPAVAMLRALAAREDRGRPVRVLHVARDAQSLALWNGFASSSTRCPKRARDCS